MDVLTDNEKRDLINREITLAYPKMYKDSLRITGYNSDMWEDLLPFCLHEFLTKKSIDYQYKVACVDKKILNYMGRAMSLQLKSNNSPFWLHYRKSMYNNRGIYLAETNKNYIQGEFDEIRLTDETDEYDCMLIQLEKLDFYRKPLVTDYYLNGMTFVQMNKKYGISLRHLKIAVEEGLEIIRKHCKAIL